MKTKIGKFKPKFTVNLPYGGGELSNLEMVLYRTMRKSYRERNNSPLVKPLSRLDVREAIAAMRYIRKAKVEVRNVD
jgi:hypothetical protein